MADEISSRGAPAPGPTQAALSVLLELRLAQPATVADLSDPFRQEWLAESASGQALKTNRETLRLLDILCWAREDPAILLSGPELVADLGRQLAQLMTLALYLGALNELTLEQFSRSYEAACARSEAGEPAESDTGPAPLRPEA